MASLPSAGAAASMSAGHRLHGRQIRSVWDFEDIGDRWTGADADKIFPIVAVPTTAGTGSEVGRAGVLTDDKTHTKRIIFHPKMMPKIVIADPELTVGMPPSSPPAPAWTRSRIASKPIAREFYHPIANGVALEGVRLAFENLPTAVKNGTTSQRAPT